MELQYPPTPPAVITSTTAAGPGNEAPSHELESVPSSSPARPPLVRFPPFSRFISGLNNESMAEPAETSSTCLSPLLDIELRTLDPQTTAQSPSIQEELEVADVKSS
ncbi:hypothetical protein B0H10DRAFT_1948049 [Mycena sp. CBHHK59/15]|nr:hypothetical protein B0H10DRAFT_1948049 [Mycena sp. CBHHK59/15]